MRKTGIIGYGNMGRAIAERIKEKFPVSIFDKDKKKTQGISIPVSATLEDLARDSETIILAVKPQDFDLMLDEIKAFTQDKLIITIAAGITTRYIKNRLGEKIRVIRAMPNMAAQIGKAVSVMFKEDNATEQDLDEAWQLLNSIGLVLVVGEEKMINAATAVSGSGPAFFCHYIKEKQNAQGKRDEFIKKLSEAAVSIGFDKREADVLSEKTVDGIIAMLKQGNASCEDIIARVSSKGGTTSAGLEVLKAGGSLEEAVKSASRRADELGQYTPR